MASTSARVRAGLRWGSAWDNRQTTACGNDQLYSAFPRYWGFLGSASSLQTHVPLPPPPPHCPSRLSAVCHSLEAAPYCWSETCCGQSEVDS
ncbi:hypothetical protein RRG08_050908 [Elysia crispata]|uniref:Uncharacterized protein n=1 Tax=Elysia crispata TaxID=231223 RepID=A0AAE1DL40_9GAST|nr:hypothetical protein RRG08_050908 [Elysia crispata]